MRPVGFAEKLNTPWAVLAVLGVMLAVNGMLLYRYPAGPFAGAEPPASEQTGGQMETGGPGTTSPFEDSTTVAAPPEGTTSPPTAPPEENTPPSVESPAASQEEVAPPAEPDSYGTEYYQY